MKLLEEISYYDGADASAVTSDLTNNVDVKLLLNSIFSCNKINLTHF